MDFAQQSKPSLWNALLWKDFQQVKSTYAVVVGGMFAFQLICFMAFLLIQHEETRIGFIGASVTLACIAPILLALGCSGMLIGHERQTGTWAWSSSLPVSWTQALTSKLLVAIAGSLGVCIPLAIIPVWFLFTQAQRLPEASESTLVVLGSLLIFAELVAFCFVATLLMRDTLMALIVAAVAILFINVFIPTFLAINTQNALSRWGMSNKAAGGTAVAIAICGLALFSGVLLTIVFRWRWGVGQRASLAFWERFKVASLPSNAQYQFANGTVPGEWWMLVRHSVTNSFWLRLATATGTLLLCMTDVSFQPDFVPLVFLPVVVCVFGITAFEGDRTLSRFRFLSDRGVDPWKLLLSRMGIAALWALATILAALFMSLWWRGFSERAILSIGIIPVAFLIGAFASMCFRKPLIAVGAACVISLGALVATTSVVGLVWSVAGPTIPFNWIVLYFSPVAMIGLLAGIFRMAKPWLVADRDSIAAHCIWMSAAATLSPVFLASTFGFLLIPRVDMQFNVTEFSPTRQVAVPDFSALADVLCSELKPTDWPDSLPDLGIVAQWGNLDSERVKLTGNSVVGQVTGELTQQRKTTDENLTAVFAPSIPRLEEIMNREALAVEAYNVPLSKLDTLIARTAALATIAMQREDAESSVRLWKVNRQLQEVAQQCNPVRTHASRNVSMHLLLQARNGEIAAMGGPEVFRTLIPSIAQERTASMAQVSQRLNSYRELHSNSDYEETMMLKTLIARYYPPINWLIERQMFLEGVRGLKSMSQLREDYLTCQTRDLLVERVSR